MDAQEEAIEQLTRMSELELLHCFLEVLLRPGRELTIVDLCDIDRINAALATRQIVARA